MGQIKSYRNTSFLQPEYRENLRELLLEVNAHPEFKLYRIKMKPYETWRSLERSAVLYRQGRTLAQIKRKARDLRKLNCPFDLGDILLSVGPQAETRIVTSAGPGQSYHNYGLAADCGPFYGGRILWSRRDLFSIYGKIAKRMGLAWLGPKDTPHTNLKGTHWRDLVTSLSLPWKPGDWVS